MKAIIVYRPERDQHDVYLYVDAPEGRIGMRLVEGAAGWQYVRTPEGGELPVTMQLPPEALGAIVDAATHVLPVDAGTIAALDDARATRDRLLALVEHAVTRPRR